MHVYEVFEQNRLSSRIQVLELRLDRLQDCDGAKALLAHARTEYAFGNYAQASEDVNAALSLLEILERARSRIG
jgi:hypothetical protein